MPMRFSWAKTPTMDEISRVNRGLMCPAVTTGCVLGGVCGGGHCAPRRGHCASGPTRGRGGVRTPRAEGGAGTSRAGPWVGCGPGRGGEDVAPCGVRPRHARPSRVAEVQETRDFTSEQFRSEIPHPQTSGASAREVPAPPSARGVRQPSRARAWGAERARGTRAPTNVGVLVRQGQRGGPFGRHAPRAARVLRAPSRCGANVGVLVRQGQSTWGPPCGRPAPRVVRVHARGAFMYGSYRNTKPKRLGNASVWC